MLSVKTDYYLLAMSVKTAIVPGNGGVKHLYGKNRPAQAGIRVAETGIPARRDGTKNVPLPYKQYAIKTIETHKCKDPGHRPVPVNVPSRLSHKQALRQCQFLSFDFYI